VAGVDAVYAKARADERFGRFDAANAGLSERCNEDAEAYDDSPPKPFWMCPVISVAGAAPGKALVGFDGYGWEYDGAFDWAKNTGGVDVVAFDAASGEMSRIRHALIAAPPHVVCDYRHEQWVETCEPPPGAEPLRYTPWWDGGRRLVRRIAHIAVNHDPSTLMYGDAWMGGGHATLAALLANTGARSWAPTTTGLEPAWWGDAEDVWDHLHPIIDVTLPNGSRTQHFGAGYAVSIDPTTGIPWGSNGVRTAAVEGYGPDLSHRQYGLRELDLWPDGDDPFPIGDASDDSVRSLSHCADGTLWAGSMLHGLARVTPSGAISYVALPGGEGVQSVACDPRDGSVWVGPTSGGVLRFDGGEFESFAPEGAPAFALQPVESISVDRWSSGGSVVYFGFAATRDSAGVIVSPGGVGAYDGQ